MIINERNDIVKYSIICMFRKYFYNFVPCFLKKHYLCTLENMIETFTKEEQAIFIVARFGRMRKSIYFYKKLLIQKLTI